MFSYRYDENFEPSRRTKGWYLFTHKTGRSFHSVVLPGLFETTHYEWQVIGVFVLLVLEFLATALAWSRGVAIPAIMASVAVDFVLALTAHLPQKDICKMKNEMVYEVNEENTHLGKLIGLKKALRAVFYFAILLSAAFKFLWFYLVHMRFDSVALFVLVCYFVGAVLHITCTGYAVFTFIGKVFINREHDRYIKNRQEYSFDPESPRKWHIVRHADVLQDAEAGRHRLRVQNDGAYLATLGVLTDAELSEMIGKQDLPEGKRLLAIEGVRHQMSILQLDSSGRVDRVAKVRNS